MSTVLRGLKHQTENITAIVTVADDGKTDGTIRRDFNVLAPTDVRKCLIALAEEEQMFAKIFAYRFPHGRGLKGHTLGNLMLLALTELTGSYKKAIREFSEILNIKGQVLPATYDDVILSARLTNGKMVWGESAIYTAGHRSPVKEVYLYPEKTKANPDAIKAIGEADLILIGPGSLYTSIIPNFLIKNMAKAVAESKAKKIYICNVSTERGETENYSVADHIKALVGHSDPKIIDVILVNSKLVLKSSGKRLGEVKNITTAEKKIGNYKVFSADLIDDDSPLYHDSEKLIKALAEIIK